jgi:multimeric flavodoxin WrbA
MDKQITIIADLSLGDETYRGHVQGLHNTAEEEGYSVSFFDVSQGTYHFCTGCWTCWWKTPGRCVFADDIEKIYPEVLRSQLLILAAPLVLGFLPASMKKIIDRFVPLVHPYIQFVAGESHHRARYAHMPEFTLVVHKEDDTDQEDLEIVHDIAKRFSLNFKTTCEYLFTTETSPREVLHEALHI